MTTLALLRPPDSWRQPALRALNWWTAELAGMLPPAVRRGIDSGRATPLCLHVGRTGARLSSVNGEQMPPFRVPIGADGAHVVTWLHRRFPGAAVAIELEDDLVFRGAIDLPATAENALPRILPHQLERLMPLDPATLGLVWRVAERFPSRKSIRVEVSVVRQRSLDEARAVAHSLRLRPRAIRVPQASGPPLAIWSEAAAHAVSPRRRRWLRGLEAGAAALFVAAYLVTLHRLDVRAAALRAQLVDVEARLETVRSLSHQLTFEQNFLGGVMQRMATASPLTVLNELSLRVPLDAYASEFDYRPPRIALNGSAAHATRLLAALSASPLLADPGFEAPITSVPGSAREHFEIGATLKPRVP